MKKSCSKTLKTLINELNRPVGFVRNFSVKSYLHYSKTNNIGKVEIFHVLHDKVALLMKRRYERGTKNSHQKIFRKVWII